MQVGAIPLSLHAFFVHLPAISEAGVTEKRNLAEHPRRDHRYVQHYFDDDGCYVLRARLAPEDGAVIEAALTSARRALGAESGADTAAMSDSCDGCGEPPAVGDHSMSGLSDGSAEPAAAADCAPGAGAFGASNADALVAMAETALAGGGRRSRARTDTASWCTWTPTSSAPTTPTCFRRSTAGRDWSPRSPGP